MIAVLETALPTELASELETKYFWWDPPNSQRRTSARILAQAMNYASLRDVLRLENELGSYPLVQAMLSAEPGWISDRSWEFWRGRLVLATGCARPEAVERGRDYAPGPEKFVACHLMRSSSRQVGDFSRPSTSVGKFLSSARGVQ